MRILFFSEQSPFLRNRVGATIEQLGTVLPGYSGPATFGLTKPRA